MVGEDKNQGFVAVAKQSASQSDQVTRSWGQKSGSFLDKSAIVFDWDDTLFASSAMSSYGLHSSEEEDLTSEMQGLLIELEEHVISVLEKAVRFGKVCIITNADNGWVALCGERFFPRALSFIERKEIPVISARHLYESKYPTTPTKWKEAAFAEHIAPWCHREEDMNVLVLGDGLSERLAAHAFAKNRTQARVKTVKFVEHPTIKELVQQLFLLETSFDYIWEHDGTFDIDLNFQ
uniref:Uncharacterized protein n=2 Tax=Rhodosorus marinus TaxID=101924 RepID=A0A7S3A6E8_9RHOD|mmetsp:Transcript_5142/g.22178  ORF Transcript_5142/g.22178 Transcript_5142/m.22178 type:complete len:236 (+) Transcript_5142:82-789(+)|eukprot:CAMPEP_0113966880 /NCGR_PEP_ID=MMETSP0011_2-20120614/8559_1 /TAXON_ID=101924 /ORGANISM="Rhodosorus marinus" /LENGTH=235 /DNA_ID=CAMNT_0000979579 /DNA_START=50 /DNA_END=757 /DNA_ORIENTATION=- /assembly_acc=CAM_ASM_000156